MSNFEEKFNDWQEKMEKKSEKEQHNYALSVALFITAIVTFFIASKWYFVISGDDLKTSLFTDIENFYNERKNGIMSE